MSGGARGQTWILTAALLALVLLGYGRGLVNGFVWDDQHVIVKGRAIGSLANLPALFLHNAMWNSDGGAAEAEERMDTYRPLTLVTFALERAVWGLWPVGYHLGSVLLHGLNACLLFWLGRRLGRPDRTSFLAAALFAVHPAISEAVFWINGRSDPLMLAFALGAVLLSTGGRWRPVAVALLVFAATLCKETAFVLIPPLVLGLVVVGPRRGWLLLLPFATGLVLGFVARLGALSGPALTSHPEQLGYALFRVPLLWLDGLVAIFVPAAELRPSLFERYREVSPGRFALAVGLAAVLLGLALWLWRKEHRRGGIPGRPVGNGRLLTTALCVFAVVMAPVGLLTFDEGWSGWGRYLYGACPLLILAVVGLVEDGLGPHLTPRVARIYLAAWGGLLFLGVVQLVLAAPAWNSDVSLGIAQMVDDPESSAGYAWTAQHFLESQQAELALPLAEKAVELAPDNPTYQARLALAYSQLGRHVEAAARARRALALDPASHVATYVLGLAALAAGDESTAARNLIEAVAAKPRLSGLWKSLAEAYAARGPDSAFRLEIRKLARDPRYAAIAARLAESP